MLGFTRKMFIAKMKFVGCGSLISSKLLKSVPRSNQECKLRIAIVNIKSNEPLFYP